MKRNRARPARSAGRWLVDAMVKLWIGTRLDGIPLFRVLALVILALVCPHIARGCLQILRNWRDERIVHAMQDRVKSMEDSLSTLQGVRADRDGGLYTEIVYRDRVTRQHVVIDRWEAGRLAYRNYFREGHLVARDTFHYEKAMPTGKTREYLVGPRRVLVDEFTQAGVLISKRYCPNGEEGKCQTFVRYFISPLPPSPLPPSTLPIYR